MGFAVALIAWKAWTYGLMHASLDLGGVTKGEGGVEPQKHFDHQCLLTVACLSCICMLKWYADMCFSNAPIQIDNNIHQAPHILLRPTPQYPIC
jgi:hypothetical protein